MPIFTSRKLHISISLFFALAAFFVSNGCASIALPHQTDTLIRRVHVVDTVTGAIRRDQAIAIRHDTIVAILSDRSVGRIAPTTSVIDGANAFAIPGLWDAHVHVYQGGADKSLRRAARLLGHGITHVRDMGASLAEREEALRHLDADLGTAPYLFAAGPAFWAFSLPYGDASAKVVVTETAKTQAAVDSVVAAGVDFIKVYAGFTSDRLRTLVEAARLRGLRVAGHAQPGVSLEQHAMLGMLTLEHLDFSTLEECTSREASYFERVIAARFRGSGESVPGIIAAFATDVDTEDCRANLRRAAEAGLVLVPTLSVSYLSRETTADVVTRLDGDERELCELYLRDFEGAGSANGDVIPDAGRRLMRMIRDAGVPVLAGSDAPAFCSSAGEGLLMELQLYGESGYLPPEVLRTATLLPSQVLTPHKRLGQLATGYEAHVLLLRDDPLISTSAYREPLGLWTRGRWHDEAQLRALRNR